MKAYIPANVGEHYWRNIPGYEGKYQANRIGEVRRVYESGKVRNMTPYKKKNKVTRNRLFVKLTHQGIPKEVPMLKIMAVTFFKEPPAGKVPYHKNGIVTDNRVENIGFTDRSTLGKISGSMTGRRMSVLKVNEQGEEVEVYRSAREAAKKNHMSYQTLLDRCHGKVKNPYALDGHTYKFEDGRPGRKRRKDNAED